MKNIEDLMKNLSTEGGRARAVQNLVGKYQISENYINEAIGFFEKNGEEYNHILTDAAEIAKKAGMLERSESIYDRAINKEIRRENINYAARIAEEAGMTGRAIELYDRDSKKDEKEGRFYFAAKAAESAGMHDRAKTLFIRIVNSPNSELAETSNYDSDRIVERINEVTKKTGMEDQKQRLYDGVFKEYAERWNTIPGAGYMNAAKFAEKLGMDAKRRELITKAIEGYAKSGDHFSAIRLFEENKGLELELEIKEEIIFSMGENGRTQEAIGIAEKMEMPGRVRDLSIRVMKDHESVGDFKDAAEFAEKLGMTDKARSYNELADLMKEESIS